jgi:CheY-like chemotaxis protein
MSVNVLDPRRVVHCHHELTKMSRPKTILVVDDDVAILRLAREVLATFEDCTVETTASPEYAFELIIKKPYDLLIFDLNMPELSGATLYSLIRTLFRVALPDDRTLPPMILMTGAAGQSPGAGSIARTGSPGLHPEAVHDGTFHEDGFAGAGNLKAGSREVRPLQRRTRLLVSPPLSPGPRPAKSQFMRLIASLLFIAAAVYIGYVVYTSQSTPSPEAPTVRLRQ